MKKIIKVISVFLIAIILLIFAILGYYTNAGYQMYQEALKESSMEERINKIRSMSNYTTLDNIPVQFKNAIIAIEDHRFETHGAVDLISIARAIYINLTEGELLQGGSTISQQFAKNTFFTQETKFTRKIAEIFAAVDLEKNYSKDEIIEMYMNTIYFGEGYYGIYSASKGYYGKIPIELNLDEITLLAGVPNAPSVYSPAVNINLARKRQKYVIKAMLEYGYLTQLEASKLGI